MSTKLPAGWTTKKVTTLGRRKRVGGKTLNLGRRSQIRTVRLPGEKDDVTYVTNELGDVRLYRDLATQYPTEVDLRFLLDGHEVRKGYSGTGIPGQYQYGAVLPHADGGAFDLLVGDYRVRDLSIARWREGGQLRFDWPTGSTDFNGVPETIDWHRNGKQDLLRATPDGKLLRHSLDATDQLQISEHGEPVLAWDTPIELPGPIFPAVVDWSQRGRSDLLIGTGDGYVFLFEDIGDDSEVRYARPRRLSDENGFLKFAEGACPTVLKQGSKRYLVVVDGLGDVYSYPINKTNAYTTGDLFDAFGGSSAGIAKQYEKGKWRVEEIEGRQLLIAAPQGAVPEPYEWIETGPPIEKNQPVHYDPPAGELTLQPPTNGLFEVHVTLVTPPQSKKGSSLEVRLSDEQTHTVLAGSELHKASVQTVYFKAADLTGKQICFQQLVGALWMTGGLPVFIESVTLVPLKKLPKSKPRRKAVPVAGISDTVDWTMWIKTHTPERVDDFVAKHKDAGFDILYHKMGGGTWEYPSRVSGAQSVVPPADIEGLTPMDDQDRANCEKRIEIQNQLNWVQLTADACHKRDMQCIGWMRIQNHGERLHGKGPLDQFYVDHPEYREQNIEGKYLPGKLCLAYREVRDFHIALCEEAIDLGCDGIMMDTMRHLPKALHGDPVCAIFKERYGEDMRTLPPYDSRVLEVQSEVFTSFLKEVRDAIKAKKPDAVLHVRVCKPYEAFGCNPADWAKQGIADEIIIEDRYNMQPPDIEGLCKAVRRTDCKAGAVFCRTRWAKEKLCLHPYRIETQVADYLKVGANSITFYETADIINHPEFCRAIRRINDEGERPSIVF